MAFSAGGSNGSSASGGFGRRFRGGTGTLSEINIVPLVDVVLVLLIIFMLTAHVMEFGLEIRRPAGEAGEGYRRGSAGGQHHQGRAHLSERDLDEYQPASCRRSAATSKATKVYVQADRNVIWDPVAQVIAELGDAKFEVAGGHETDGRLDAPAKREDCDAARRHSGFARIDPEGRFWGRSGCMPA